MLLEFLRKVFKYYHLGHGEQVQWDCVDLKMTPFVVAYNLKRKSYKIIMYVLQWMSEARKSDYWITLVTNATRSYILETILEILNRTRLNPTTLTILCMYSKRSNTERP